MPQVQASGPKPNWWNQQDPVIKFIVVICSIGVFGLGLALLPPALVVGGILAVPFAAMRHAYEVTHEQGSWNNPSAFNIFLAVAGLLTAATGGLLMWIF